MVVNNKPNIRSHSELDSESAFWDIVIVIVIDIVFVFVIVIVFVIEKCMLMKIRVLFLYVIASMISTSSCAQHIKTLGEAKSPTASIEDLAWIEGSWKGEALGGQTEEVWAAPSAGSMMGMFKLISEGEISFYEILTITEQSGSLLLRLKHFDKELKGWEEKDESIEFPLVEVKKDAVYFDGLTFKNASPNQLQVFVNINDEEVEFLFNRK